MAHLPEPTDVESPDATQSVGPGALTSATSPAETTLSALRPSAIATTSAAITSSPPAKATRTITKGTPILADEDEELDPDDDPVVRSPKNMVELPEPASYPRATVARVGALAGGVGASLGIVGLVVAMVVTRALPRLWHRGERARTPHAQTSAADAGAGVFALELTQPDGGLALGDSGLSLAVAQAPSALAAHTPEGWVATSQRLGRGRPLPVALRAMGIERAEIPRIIAAMRPMLNMRGLQPADVVAIQRDPQRENALRRVEYRRGESEVIAVNIDAEGAHTAERIRVVKTQVRVAAGFIVRGSLSETLQSAHLQADIVSALQEVFAELELGRELHEGDAVRLVVVEERVNESFFRYGRIDALDFRGAGGRTRRAFFQPLSARGGIYYDAQGNAETRGPLRPPVNPPRITSPFNPHRMHPVLHRVMPHQGTDFGAPAGTPIMAAGDGTVTFRGWGGATGNLVRLHHPGINLETGYAHMTRFEPGITVGSHVRVGQVIGYVGSTGRSTGPHLHWSVKRGGVFIDGAPFLSWRRSVPANLRANFDARVQQLNTELDAVVLVGATAAPPPGTAVNPSP
ncbi:MAG: peptidoglycan DD-metalloendopeptidase family protein [Deltaproteobacteria bacterium]|nr:peptidoglycan DD-metalloendopeptidase family protein [Deltaproteobacteria bacterium]